MGIRTLCAAAVVAAGAGQAEAATIPEASYQVVIRLTETLRCDGSPCEDDPQSYPPFFEGIPLEQHVRGTLSFGPDNYDGNYYTGSAVEFSSSAIYTVLGVFASNSPGNYYSNHDPNLDYALWFSWDGVTGAIDYYLDEQDFQWDRMVTGTIELAPVPLPASAALLPLGIGALAMVRKRRKP